VVQYYNDKIKILEGLYWWGGEFNREAIAACFFISHDAILCTYNVLNDYFFGACE